MAVTEEAAGEELPELHAASAVVAATAAAAAQTYLFDGSTFAP
jgi:hypothetical protein